MAYHIDVCKAGRHPRLQDLLDAVAKEGMLTEKIWQEVMPDVARTTIERHRKEHCACYQTEAKNADPDPVERERAMQSALAHKADQRAMTRRILELEKELEHLRAIDAVVPIDPRQFERPKKRAHKHVGIANMVLSDLHLDEVVSQQQVQGVNKFDRRIAELRLQKLFEGLFTVAENHITGIDYEGLVLPMLGDTFSGNIHEELKETNEVGILESLEYWVDPFIGYIKAAADLFGTVHVPVTVGNHGRLSRKPVAKNRVTDNYDWFFARMLARALKDDSRITWQIEESPDCMMKQYNTTFLYTHGDQFRGGSGIAGLLSPLMLGDHRKRKRQNAVGQPYDVMVLGHWHTYLSVPTFGFIVNGSLKGYDEYAYISNFGFEVPQQAFWVTTPEHGVTFSAPILCQDRAAEKW